MGELPLQGIYFYSVHLSAWFGVALFLGGTLVALFKRKLKKIGLIYLVIGLALLLYAGTPLLEFINASQRKAKCETTEQVRALDAADWKNIEAGANAMGNAN